MPIIVFFIALERVFLAWASNLFGKISIVQIFFVPLSLVVIAIIVCDPCGSAQ